MSSFNVLLSVFKLCLPTAIFFNDAVSAITSYLFFSINDVLLKYSPRNGTHVFETENYTFWIPQVCLEVTLLHVPETSLLVSISSEIDNYPIF